MRHPPLNSLRAFEAAARTGSFSSAAAELGVSSSAVSMQVRNLEKWLEKRLFTRSNNRIALTDAGRALYPGVADAFGGLASLTARILEPAGKARIVVSVMPSLAERWLAPRLAEFARNWPQISLQLRIEDDPVDFARHRIALRIGFGGQFYPDFRVEPLFHDSVTPVLPPALLNLAEGGGALERIGDEMLIHGDWGEAYATQPRWRDWFRLAGSDRNPDMARGHSATTTSATIALAARGLGVTLSSRRLAAAELASGALFAPSETEMPLAEPYCAILPHARARERELLALVAALRD
jgi:LysR family glycine cleavage system transcriptional activator